MEKLKGAIAHLNQFHLVAVGFVGVVVIIIRFRRRNDVEVHLWVLRRQASNLRYDIVFDPVCDRPDVSSNRLNRD